VKNDWIRSSFPLVRGSDQNPYKIWNSTFDSCPSDCAIQPALAGRLKSAGRSVRPLLCGRDFRSATRRGILHSIRTPVANCCCSARGYPAGPAGLFAVPNRILTLANGTRRRPNLPRFGAGCSHRFWIVDHRPGHGFASRSQFTQGTCRATCIASRSTRCPMAWGASFAESSQWISDHDD
jgi:hypothetical protein